MSGRPRLDVRLTTRVACAGCASKLGPADLRKALAGLPRQRRDPRVLVDQSTLDDAGVFAHGKGEALVQTVDFFTPILDDPYDYGQVAAANAVSDVYAMGGRPLTALAIVCVPEHPYEPDVLREILRGGQAKLQEAGASVVGGHTVTNPELKIGYSITGLVARRRLLRNSGARAGDRLVLTKPLGAGILTTALKQDRLEPALLKRLTRVLTTLNREASAAAVAAGARGATDVTGYGLLGHARQMAEASGVTFRLRPDPGWFLPRVLALAAEGVAPGGLARNRTFYSSGVAEGGGPEPLVAALYDPQTSGGLLIAIPARRAPALRTALKRRRVWSVEVGEAVTRTSHAIELAF